MKASIASFEIALALAASSLNQSSWMLLEGAERKLAVDGRKIVQVLTGPLFEKMMPPLPSGPKMHRVPSGYWKAIAVEKGGATREAGFLFDQETPRGIDYCTRRAALGEGRAEGADKTCHKGKGCACNG